jgi:flagellar biosynthesis protein FlhB
MPRPASPPCDWSGKFPLPDVIVTGRDVAVAVRFDQSTMLAPRVVVARQRDAGALDS